MAASASALRPRSPWSPGDDCGTGGRVTPTSLAADECICFEGALSGTSNYAFRFVTLTNSNDCAKLTGNFLDIKARARCPGQAGDDVLIATGSVSYLGGGDGADDSCTLDGVTKTDNDGSKYSGCE